MRRRAIVAETLYELETRALAGLPVDATIQTVERTGQMLLSNAAQATEIPGVDLSKLSGERKTAALQRLNSESCTCGCELTLAQCRINDPSCDVSLPVARKIVDELASDASKTAAGRKR